MAALSLVLALSWAFGLGPLAAGVARAEPPAVASAAAAPLGAAKAAPSVRRVDSNPSIQPAPDRIGVPSDVRSGAPLPAASHTTASPRPSDFPLPVVVARGNVTVRAQAGMESVARKLADEAAPALAAIAEDLPQLPVLRAVELRLVRQADDLSNAAPDRARVPEWAIGVAFPREGVVVVAQRRGAEMSDVSSVATHELAHMALGAALGDRAPRWLHEGFAYIHASDFSFDRASTLTGMAWGGGVIPLGQLDRSFPAQEVAAGRAYAESYDFVSFLARRGRYQSFEDDGNRWPFRQFLIEIASGKSLDDAALAAYSTPLGGLFGEWESSLRARYLMLPIGLVGALIWVVAAVLLIMGYLRKRRLNRRTLERWDVEERSTASAAAAGAATATPLALYSEQHRILGFDRPAVVTKLPIDASDRDSDDNGDRDSDSDDSDDVGDDPPPHARTLH